ncbi:MAG: NAD(P)H-dependent oxidoreductase [Hyphomicrobiales bacterium]
MSRKILVIDAHPAGASFCSALAERYAEAARAGGAAVELVALRDIAFDPILHQGYGNRQEWEPGLAALWASIEAAGHVCFVYPTWWGGHPALLQGFFERVFLPGKAFAYHKDDPYWDRLLAGRTCDVLTTMDSPAWYYRFVNRNGGIARIRRTILEFVGMKTKVHVFDRVKYSDAGKRSGWLDRAATLGRAAAA